MVGNGVGELIDMAVPEGTDGAIKEKVLADFGSHYKEHCFDRTGPYKGIRECINALKTAGMKVAVVSNKMDYAVGELCDRFFPGFSTRQSERRRASGGSHGLTV